MTSVLKGRPFLAACVLTTLALLVINILVSMGLTDSRSTFNIPIVESEHPYPDSSNDFWVVTNIDSNAKASRLYFTHIELEDAVDHIIISDAYDKEFQRLTGIYTDGVWTDPVPGNEIKIRLVSDSSVSAWGFAADQIESVDYDSLASSAHPYSNNINEEWILTNSDPGAEGSQVHFSHLELENGVDRILIMDPYDTIYQYITQTHSLGLWTIGVPGNDVKIRLETDSSVANWGFNIDQISSTTAASPALPPSPGPTLAESEHPYAPGLNQTWTIVNPNLDAVSTKIHFDTIDLYNYGDRVFIRDNDDNLIQEIAYDATDLWTDYVPGRIIKVQFVDDGNSYTAWGFRVDAVADGEPLPVLAQSEHPYPRNLNNTWVIINPNLEAVSTKIHFDTIDLYDYGDRIFIRDNDDNLIQEIAYDATDLWTDYVPGRIIKVQFVDDGNSYTAWGFRVDDLAPRTTDTPASAFISGVYINIFAPAIIYLDEQEVLCTDHAGELKIPLSGKGDYVIRIEYRTLDMEQQIQVSLSIEGNLTVVYLPLVVKDFPD